MLTYFLCAPHPLACVCVCVCFKCFHSDAEIVPSWLLKLYWLLWNEFNLGFQSAACDVQKAPTADSPTGGGVLQAGWGGAALGRGFLHQLLAAGREIQKYGSTSLSLHVSPICKWVVTAHQKLSRVLGQSRSRRRVPVLLTCLLRGRCCSGLQSSCGFCTELGYLCWVNQGLVWMRRGEGVGGGE